MPRTTGPIQRVRPAAAPARAGSSTQTSAARTARTAPRATLSTPVAGATTGQTQTNTPTPAATPTCACGCACGNLECLDRTRFFSGQLLTAGDLRNEQQYLLAKNRLHNLYLHGSGVVCGLQVSCSPCPGWVTINPGYAIDPCGNDIIVCAAQSFNVIEAIQTCCTPQSSTPDCSPLRYRPAPTCQDAEQQWCITIQYAEQASQMVTALQPSSTTSTSSGCSCGCGGSTSKSSSTTNGCGCGGSSSTTSATTSAASTTTAASCEPTRTIEGFQLGICQPQTATAAANSQTGLAGFLSAALGIVPQPGTFWYQFEQCYQSLYSLVLQQPVLTGYTTQQAYQAASQYLTSAQNALGAAYMTHCLLETGLDTIQIPTDQSQANYIALLQALVKVIADVLIAAALDCLCAAMLPPCPPAACDNRLILACVTVRNGAVVDICHFGGGRTQVLTAPTLSYWLSFFPLFDSLSAGLTDVLETLCCGGRKNVQTFFARDFSQRAFLMAGSNASPASVNQALASYIAQRLGAGMVNAISPNASTVDLRPLVGLETENATAALERYKITSQTLTKVDVSTDPSWTDAAIKAGPLLAPAAFTVTDPLTMYTRGDIVVGFDVTSPFAVLQKQVDNLTAQLAALQPSSSQDSAK